MFPGFFLYLFLRQSISYIYNVCIKICEHCGPHLFYDFLEILLFLLFSFFWGTELKKKLQNCAVLNRLIGRYACSWNEIQRNVRISGDARMSNKNRTILIIKTNPSHLESMWRFLLKKIIDFEGEIYFFLFLNSSFF